MSSDETYYNQSYDDSRLAAALAAANEQIAELLSQLVEVRKALGLDCGCQGICRCDPTDVELADDAVDAAQRLRSYSFSQDKKLNTLHEQIAELQTRIKELERAVDARSPWDPWR